MKDIDLALIGFGAFLMLGPVLWTAIFLGIPLATVFYWMFVLLGALFGIVILIFGIAFIAEGLGIKVDWS